MPTADSILAWAAELANDWRWLAIVWHLALALLVAVLASGARPQRRLFGALLAAPVVSVAVLAWASGNAFNALSFAVIAALLGYTAGNLSAAPVEPASAGWALVGTALVTFGWVYPHFLQATTWLEYAYASPFGLLPCPTLTVVIGLTMMFGGLRSTAWTLTLSSAGLAYGAIGVFGLGVWLDVWLLAGAALLIVKTGVDLRQTGGDRVDQPEIDLLKRAASSVSR